MKGCGLWLWHSLDFSLTFSAKIFHFWAFHIFGYFSPKWANIYISSVLWSTGGDLHHFKGLSRKWKELKFFMNENLRKNVNSGHFTVLHISHPNEQIFTFQVSSAHLVAIFIILKAFFRKSKKLKFFMTADLRKNVNFGHFTVLHISQPNEQIFTFQVSSGHLVVIFIILKDFPESRKIWRFSWPRTCEKLSFLDISQFCIFLTQMSKYSHFKCPVVNWWWFSSF